MQVRSIWKKIVTMWTLDACICTNQLSNWNITLTNVNHLSHLNYKINQKVPCCMYSEVIKVGLVMVGAS